MSERDDDRFELDEEFLNETAEASGWDRQFFDRVGGRPNVGFG